MPRGEALGAHLATPLDWEIAVHEAAHAEVGLYFGWSLLTVTLVPPLTQFAPGTTDRSSRRKIMAVYAAGHLAEETFSGRSTDRAFEASIERFFNQLGDQDIYSPLASGIAAFAPEDDVYELACLIDSYSTRGCGWWQFRQARSSAVEILTAQWAAIEARAHKLLQDQ